VEFRILGPLQVYADDGQLSVFEPRPAKVLAVLLLAPNQVIAREYLIDAVWDDDPPVTAKRQLQNCVSTLRRTLAGGDPASSLITTDDTGYRIHVDQGQLDAQRFRELAAAAEVMRSQGRIVEATRQLRSALMIWRGPALTGMAGRAIQAAAARLEEQRLATLETCLDLELQLGRHQELVGELVELATSHPLRERLVGQLMLALCRSGRRADALLAYQRLRERLADELGLDPGSQIQQLHTAILRNAPAARGTTPAPPAGVPANGRPRQLPAPPRVFTGRCAELADLDRMAGASTVVVTAIEGMAGIGKTALAVRAAHRIAGRFPDGQIFIDLHGYTNGVTPVGPGDVLDRVLRTLGVDGEQIPVDLDERIGLYRSRLADRRMLLVLDNAASEDQVQPLIPGVAGCLLLVTSRRRLAGLDPTHTISLGTLPPPDAATLFTRTVGAQRLAGQPPATVSEIVELCGRLPLAIRIAAAWLTSHPAWQVADLAERLRDHDRRLVELDDGARSVIAALELSYQRLSNDEQRAYRLLGLHPGPDIDLHAAAALAGATIAQAGRLCDQLLYANLLQETAPARYVFHDLVRTHAASTAARDETGPARRAALTRLLDHHRHTAAVAMDTVHPYERDSRPRVPPAGTPTPDLPDPARATGWLDAELPNLLAVAQHAAERGWPEHAWQLSATLHRHLRTRGRYRDAARLHQQVLTTRDPHGELSAMFGLGDIHRLQGRHEQAKDHFERALAIARRSGNRAGELNPLRGLGEIHRRAGQHEQAIAHFQRALAIARDTGNQTGELNTLFGLGTVHLLQGRYQQAAGHYAQTLEIARSTGDPTGELSALGGLGAIHRLQGRYGQAIDHYQQALAIARATGSRVGELNALRGLGTTYRLQGRYGQAADHYRQALTIARVTGHRAGELSALRGLGTIHRLQGRYGQAAECYQQVFEIACEASERNWQFEALHGLGRLYHATGRPEAALSHHRRALAVATGLRQPIDRARAHDGLAHAHHTLGQHQQARRQWLAALAILTGLGADHTDDEETTIAAIRTHLANLDR
jgi:DNA-binding SARP family transcriptional activator/tetratricopeptide (TPR) repeat protein